MFNTIRYCCDLTNQTIVNKVLDIFLHDPELPVRVAAGIDLQYLLVVSDPENDDIYAAPVIEPRLGDVLKAYLEVDCFLLCSLIPL